MPLQRPLAAEPAPRGRVVAWERGVPIGGLGAGNSAVFGAEMAVFRRRALWLGSAHEDLPSDVCAAHRPLSADQGAGSGNPRWEEELDTLGICPQSTEQRSPDVRLHFWRAFLRTNPSILPYVSFVV